MWKVVACVFLLEISTIYSARNNGYFRAFRRGYYPGKEEEPDHSTRTRNYYHYRHHGYGFPSYPAVYFLRPHPMGHYGYPVYPFDRFGETHDSIYDYKLKMPSNVEPMTTEKLEVDKPKKGTKQETDSTEIMKMNEKEEQRKMMEQETVHTPKLIPALIPKMIENMPHETTMIKTGGSSNRQDEQKLNTENKGKLGLVFNGKYPGTCDNDGLYYKDGTNYIICTNSQAIVQPCAPGTQNQDMMTFTPGSQYSQFDFCTINLVARGSYSSSMMMEDESGSKTDKLMNAKVKHYFEQHYKNYL